MVKGRAKPLALVAIAAAMVAAPTLAGPLTPLTYRDKPVNGYLGGHEDFPAVFVGQNLCENGSPAPDARSGCVKLEADGSGTWENDVAPGRRPAPENITWYVIADQQGTVTKVSSSDADTYFVLFEFAGGEKRAFPARIVKDTPARAVIDSKYRVIP
ncbi:hypothetical protein [Porphyrobacter sp. AAP60]|uniref:hypothetical protein n=1 Tax=Porphyrobacter sp. AAP60 TaxID=1523423 RepID=UPI0006B8EB59|nr:hypothetical protein [Porphyrobacter sp. AAP60]KPF62456.1 hypothetical protein IP79_12395 [Porphyrobacter sp. AAP60]